MTSMRTFIAVAVLLAQAGCAGGWSKMREWERGNAAAEARRAISVGECRSALPFIDRAQAAPDLGPFAVESIEWKASCLEKLSRPVESQALRRLLEDHYSAGDRHAGAESLAAHASGTEEPRSPSNLMVVVPKPRYSRSARQSALSGRVILELGIEHTEVAAIRVVTSAHALLDSWAIEAAANARVKSLGAQDSGIAVVEFVFEADR